jgi:H+-translocating NAD(P) transhydrogenase subunit alpha
MIIGVPAQTDEPRVAVTPDSARALVARGVTVQVASGVGAACRFADADYDEVGADLVDPDQAWNGADLLAVVTAPSPTDVARMRPGTALVGLLAPGRDLELVRALADHQVTSYALELVPRISRAQTMDALSSQAGLAGYRAAVLAAATSDKHFPLSMTAAGTLRPGVVVVLGAGVAGLQAIATAKRLGAVVRANDVRAAAKEEVASLGAAFIDVPGVTDQTGEGGYARAVGPEAAAAQQQALLPHITEADAVICTAAVPGRRAPVLLTEEMVAAMRPGALVLDLAVEDGGNCALTDPVAGTVEVDGVRIIAARQLARALPREASTLYARNVSAFLDLLLDGDGGLVTDPTDELATAATLTRDGEVVFAPVAERVAAGPAEEART